MACFEWNSARPLPARHDLRRRGWRLSAGPCDEGECARLTDLSAVPDPAAAQRERVLVVGVEKSDERARLLASGVGDAIGPEVALDELACRALRVACSLPATTLACGPLRLDLAIRDASVDGRRLRLRPREFALLWRLAEAEGRHVPRRTLLRDVFGLTIEPGTNGLAVHVCRMRKSLREAGVAHLLVTGADQGSYALVVDSAANVLDGPARLGEHQRLLEEAET